MSEWAPRIHKTDRRRAPYVEENYLIKVANSLIIHSPTPDTPDHPTLLSRLRILEGADLSSEGAVYYGYLRRKKDDWHLGIYAIESPDTAPITADQVRHDIQWFFRSTSARDLMHAGCTILDHLLFYRVIILPDEFLGTIKSILENGYRRAA